MALILRAGDYVPDEKGGFQSAQGAQELLERALWKLTVRRGSFPFLPELGSRLHLLGRALAGQYVAEALADEDVTVDAVNLTQEGDRGMLTVRLLWHGEALTATVEVSGLG